MDRDNQQVRAEEAAELHRLRDKAREVIESPPPAHGASGRVVVDPATGELVPDERVRVSAIDQDRKLSESIRKLHGADAADEDSAELAARLDRLLAWVNGLSGEILQLRKENQALKYENAALRGEEVVIDGRNPLRWELEH